MEKPVRTPCLPPPSYIYPPAEFSVAYILCIWFAVDIFYRKQIFDRQPCAGRIAAPKDRAGRSTRARGAKKTGPEGPVEGSGEQVS